MAEPNSPSLTDGQISSLADALDQWVERHPYPDQPVFSFGQSEPFSPRDIAVDLRARGPIGAQVVRMVQFATETERFESILARFYGEQVGV